MAAATGPIPGPEEVIMKKAALVTVQKQMAALVRGEDLPASQPGPERFRMYLMWCWWWEGRTLSVPYVIWCS